MATNGNFAQQEQYKGALEAYPAAPAGVNSANTAAAESGDQNLTKDQVGWYFVEQYYTTLSKSPEKLHLFYSKRSQFVYGLEAEIANVSVGRQDIQERIKKLEFQDCKVRISNVDSQGSNESIVIQVIGETSNKGQEPKKFVQTFVLAQQPSGYFVLNDILRYINDETEEETAEAPTDAAASAPEAAAEAAPAEAEAEKVAAPSEAAQLDADVVDQKLESTRESAAVNGNAEETAAPEEAPAAAEVAAPEAEAAAREAAEETAKEAEKPKDPFPTPVVKAAAPAPEAAPAAPAAPAEPAAPPKPMTWASRAAAAAGPRPVVPLPKTATPPAPAQSRAPAPAAAPAAAAPAAGNASAAAPAAAPSASKENSEWQTAGADSKRQNRPQSVSGNVVEKEGTMGYVKFVTDKVQDTDLKGALTALGELTYFDINRQKNCAFVEFKTTEGYNAAMAASPLTVNGENITIEPRRPKATAYGGASYGSGRGGASGRGRGGFEGGRTGGNPRGNFGGQGRGRGGASRGRGGAQSTNA